MTPPQDSKLKSSSARLSRSGVGRISSALGNILGSTSKVQAAGKFLQRQLWAWPIIAAVFLGATGWWVHRAVENEMRAQRARDLNATVNTCAMAVRAWAGEQRIDVGLIADDVRLRPLVKELLPLADGSPAAERELLHAPAQQAFQDILAAKQKVAGYVGFLLVTADGVVVSADQDSAIGKSLDGYRKEIFDRAIAGESFVSRPFRSTLLLTDENGQVRAQLPAMYAVGPLLDDAGNPVAALGMRIRPEDQFTRILEAARIGESGETFAFDRNGLLLSQSRFDEPMKQVGLLVDQPDVRSILNVELRDPGVNMTAGERPTLRRPDQPLTRMAAEAVQGLDGYDADGYRGYRGVPKVGAWRWLKDLDFAIGTDVDLAEALGPVIQLKRAFWTLMALLMASAVGIFFAMLYMAKQQQALRRATLAAKQLGQYELLEKLGSGGMGTVYKARHAMLRRPTAVKLLEPDKMSASAVARFEREVQLTGALTHPNTVAVFDYGRTPDGVFYYAMECLEGMNLEELVNQHGPLPEARAVYLLQQVCGSLAEAHSSRLVHRDVKPANIFLTQRGGLYDFVKVLDFGLVKAMGQGDQLHVTQANTVMGTPLYLSPEAVADPNTVDVRADVYAVGAVAYFLLTGSPIFDAANVVEICWKHKHETPQRPSVRSGRAISPGLESLIMQCLAKTPAERSKDAGELLRELDAVAVGGRWNRSDAEAWWTARESPHLQDPSRSSFTATRIGLSEEA
jgi:hypothetical protein